MKIGHFFTFAAAKLIQPDEDGTYRIKVREKSSFFSGPLFRSKKTIFSIIIRATNSAGQLSAIGAVGLNPFLLARFR